MIKGFELENIGFNFVKKTRLNPGNKLDKMVQEYRLVKQGTKCNGKHYTNSE